MVIHTLPYFNLKIALCILQICIVHFGARVAWKDATFGGTWFVAASWMHVSLQFIAMLISNTLLLNALLDMGPGRLVGKGLWWSVQDPTSLIIGNISGHMGGNVLNLIIPLVQSHVLAHQGFRTNQVSFQITDYKQ